MRSNVCPLNAFSVEGKHIGCKQRKGVQKAIMVTLSARVLFYVNCFILLSTITDTMDYEMQTLYLSILVRKSGIQGKACQWSVRNFPKFITFPFQTISCIISSSRKNQICLKNLWAKEQNVCERVFQCQQVAGCLVVANSRYDQMHRLRSMPTTKLPCTCLLSLFFFVFMFIVSLCSCHTCST